MEYNFNGTIIELQDTYCLLNDNLEPTEMNPQVNLYVRVGNRCNAACRFCTYHGYEDDFDFDKFETVLRELKSRNILGKIQLTGGEQSIYETRLPRIVDLVRQYFPDKFIGVNCNGTDLLTLLSIADQVDNFAISRHHYNDDINRQIFNKSEIPSYNQLKEFINIIGPEKVHFSCNLIKGYIDNVEEVRNYLDFCASVNCEDVGFVTLMDNNEYSKYHRVEFDSIGIEDAYGFIRYRTYRKSNGSCRCANYLYTSRPSGKFVEVYGRYVCNKSSNIGQVSFSGGTFRSGFNGEIINI